MTLISYTAPSGRAGTYETAGGDAERITALTSLLCMSLTEDGSPEEHLDNMFQAAVCLNAELEAIDSCDDDAYANAAFGIRAALSKFVDGGAA